MALVTHYRVQAFDPSGTAQYEFGTYGTADNQFTHPVDLVLGPSGDLYVLDARKDYETPVHATKVKRWTTGGTFVSAWTDSAWGTWGGGAGAGLAYNGTALTVAMLMDQTAVNTASGTLKAAQYDGSGTRLGLLYSLFSVGWVVSDRLGYADPHVIGYLNQTVGGNSGLAYLLPSGQYVAMVLHVRYHWYWDHHGSDGYDYGTTLIGSRRDVVRKINYHSVGDITTAYVEPFTPPQFGSAVRGNFYDCCIVGDELHCLHYRDNGGGSIETCVVVVDCQNLAYVRQYGLGYGTPLGYFGYPQAICADANGWTYVLDLNLRDELPEPPTGSGSRLNAVANAYDEVFGFYHVACENDQQVTTQRAITVESAFSSPAIVAGAIPPAVNPGITVLDDGRIMVAHESPDDDTVTRWYSVDTARTWSQA